MPAGHPIALEVDGDAALLTYEGLNPQDIGGVDHYSGDVLVTVDGAFGRAKLVCANHANMGDGPGGPYRLWDDAPPTVTLTGDAAVTVTEGDAYTDAGATAGEGLTAVETANDVDTAVSASYAVTYTVTDPVDLTASVTRTVTVSAAATVTVTFSNEGVETTQTLEVGAALADPQQRVGYTFGGWNAAQDGSGAAVATAEATGTVYAQWVANFDEQVVVTVNGSDDRYLLDGLDTAKKLQTGLVYLFVGVPAGHPIALEVDGDAALLTYEGLNPRTSAASTTTPGTSW